MALSCTESPRPAIKDLISRALVTTSNPVSPEREIPKSSGPLRKV